MNKKIINTVLALCVFFLVLICWRSIADDQDFNADVEYREAQVKARLLNIREAEEAYKLQNEEGAYCSDWDVLIDFVKNGKLPTVIKEGVLSDEQMEKGLTESKAAAIVRSGDMAAIKANGLEGFKRDTIWVSLYDSLFASKGINPDSLRYIPFSDCDAEQADTFEIIACPNTMKSGAIQQVMECNAPFSSYLKGMGKRGKRAIMNRTQEAEEKGAYAGLKIGEAGNGWNNNAGNWE